MSDATQAPATPPTPRTGHSLASHLVPLRKNWGWLMGAGIILVLLGIFGLVAANLFTVVSVLSFGAMMLIAGGVLIADAFRREGWKSRVAVLVIGALYIATGALVLYNPLQAVVALTILCAAMLVATGALRIVMAFQMRELVVWGWVLASGILSLLLGIFIMVQLPQAATWVLGTFLAIELIFQGWTYIFVARAIRSTFDGVHPKPAA
ncbi:MAG: HdeD family acid-resistance protein [Phreatobacter sp.]|uniref:HdeD family acid-resistance protein n=1 Tax=Phreatobacter sp. TaxID=1966341 RepID=UPI001A616B3E|nr:HdeD family acid-resistance protein [Phreatobacter sp.]MBL8569146.1 HdeD family acid-resistance protein [Phreatobacter sp.]